jgi:hypothetical protein
MAESTRYRVINKFIYRASTQDITMGTRQDGSPNVVRQPGPMQKVEVGTILDDVTPTELAAAPDRFALVDEQAQVEGPPYDVPPSLTAPLRGVHEPANALSAPIQKPPLTGPEVEARLQAEKTVAEVEARQATEAAERAKELEETRAKAYEEAVTSATQRATPSRASSRSTPPATPAAPATPPEPPATPRRSS